MRYKHLGTMTAHAMANEGGAGGAGGDPAPQISDDQANINALNERVNSLTAKVDTLLQAQQDAMQKHADELRVIREAGQANAERVDALERENAQLTDAVTQATAGTADDDKMRHRMAWIDRVLNKYHGNDMPDLQEYMNDPARVNPIPGEARRDVGTFEDAHLSSGARQASAQFERSRQ